MSEITDTDRLEWVLKNHIYVSWISRPPDHVRQTRYSFCASGERGRLPPLEGPTFRDAIDDEIRSEMARPAKKPSQYTDQRKAE